jgi:hypothetical protein
MGAARVRGCGSLFILSTLACAALLAWLHTQELPLRLGLGTDLLHHLASVRELAKGECPPRHNLVDAPIPQGHYGPYLVALGWAARLTGASPLHTLAAAAVTNLLLFALAFRWLTLRLVGPGAARWSVLAAVLLLGPWPIPGTTWPSLSWPGPTSLADAQNFCYPQMAATILLLAILAALCHASPGLDTRERARSLARIGGLTAAAALLVTTHPLTYLALGTALAACGLAWLLRGEASPSRLALLATLPVAGLAIGLAWPYYPLAGLLRAFGEPAFRYPLAAWPQVAGPSGSVLVHATGPARDLLPLVPFLGPTAVGLVGAVLLARQRRPFLLFWLAIHFVFCQIPLVPLRTRLFAFVALPLQIALAHLLDRLWTSGRLGRTVLAALLVSGAASTGMRIHWLLQQERPDLAFVERLTPVDSVILSDALTSNGVAGLAGRKVVMPHHPDLFLLMADGPQRLAGVQRFFTAITAPAERMAILRRWRVTHVLVDRLRGELPRGLPCLTTHRERGYVLCAVDPAALARGPQPAPTASQRDIGDNTPAGDTRASTLAAEGDRR